MKENKWEKIKQERKKEHCGEKEKPRKKQERKIKII
jgi:hypothetical protein